MPPARASFVFPPTVTFSPEGGKGAHWHLKGPTHGKPRAGGI